VAARSIRHAVVTGASSGIGREIATRLAAEGTVVTAVGRDAERLARVAQAVAPGRIRSLVADLAVGSEVEALGRELAASHRGLDLLVHSAGAYGRGSLADAEVADLDRQLAVNVRAPFRLTQLLLPALREAAGQVAFVNSTVVFHPPAGVAAYAASKAALRALADSLRGEVNAEGVRVVSIFVGRTDTPLQVWLHALEGRELDRSRLLAPSDVADALLTALHASPEAEVTDITLRPSRPPAEDAP
jgi:short-subunit dehydrogenase